MSEVRKLKIKSKIAQTALDGTGIRAGEAISAAEDNVALLADMCIGFLDENLAEISARFGSGAARLNEPLDDLYVLCTRIIDVVGALPDSGVAEATRSLCDLIDLTGDRSPDWRSVDVHLDAIRLLRAQGAAFGPTGRAAILVGLSDINQKARSRAA